MQVSAVISFMAMAAIAVNADFSAEDQAIWIDHHNYFRTTGLPWSAGDMRRIGWSSDLATTAASTAAKCSATTAAGVNVYQSTSNNSSNVIDEAIQQWVVETSMTTLKSLAQPGASGVDVGTGTYNSYSQVLWASTTSVGCATVSCSGGDMVVCEYSPAGNDGSSPWYVHADTASDCPSGTTASQGLCIVEGDAANNQIATIPAGKLTYEVYPAYVANMQTVLIEAARAIANGLGTNSMGATTQATTAPTATTAAPTASSSETSSSKEDSAATKTSSSKKTTTSSSSETSSRSDSAATKTGKTGKTTSSPTTDSSSDSYTKQSSKTTSSSTTDSSADSSTKQSSKTTSSSSTDASADSSTKQTSQTTASNSDESAPGTVKASSDTGSSFTNQASKTTTGSSTEQTASSTNTASSPSTASTESTTASGGAATSINNQSGTSSGGDISVVGLAGMIVLAIFGIAAFGVVMSYKRNQQRQREIMRDGGIRII